MRRLHGVGRKSCSKTTASLPLAALLFSAGIAGRTDAGPVDKVNVRKAGSNYTATITAGASLNAGSAAGSFCENFVGGLVLPEGAFVIIDSVKQDNITALLESGFEDPSGFIGQALGNFFDSETQDLFTFRFHPNSCPTEGTTIVEIVFRVKTMDGEFEFQVDLPRFTVGATNESDFNDGEPLANFLILDAPIIDETVPAVSTWGLITLSLLLLVGHKVRFRSTRQSVVC